MRPLTTFRFLPGTAGHAAHGDTVLTMHRIVRDLPGGGVLANLAESSAYTRPVRADDIEVIAQAPAAYRCEHCNRTHGPAFDILVALTSCPGNDVEPGARECHHGTCTELDALCFGDADDAMAWALERSTHFPDGAAEIFSVYTAGPERDVQERWATVVNGCQLDD